MREVRFQTADDFLAFSKACKRAGRKDLRQAVNKGLQAGVKPLMPGAAQSLAALMPSEELAGRAIKLKQVVNVSTGRDPGVRVGVPWGKRLSGGMGASNARMSDHYGRIRHPLFADREKWFDTTIPGLQGWYSRYWSALTEQIRPALDQALQDVADQVVREAQRG